MPIEKEKRGRVKRKPGERFYGWELEFIKMRRMGHRPKEILGKLKLKTPEGEDVDEQHIKSLTRSKKYITAMNSETVANGLADVTRTITRLAAQALGVMENSMHSDNEKIRLDAAKDILDRAGLKSAQIQKRINVDMSSKQMEDVISELRGLQMGSAPGPLYNLRDQQDLGGRLSEGEDSLRTKAIEIIKASPKESSSQEILDNEEDPLDNEDLIETPIEGGEAPYEPNHNTPLTKKSTSIIGEIPDAT